MPLQLGELVRRMIVEEKMRPGDRLPSETELSARFEVGRATVREALKLLEQDGLINVRHGLGRFVSAIGGLDVDRPITTYESITEMLGALGLEYTTEVLSAERIAADDDELAALELPAGSEVIRLRRIRRQPHRLLIYSVNSFPVTVIGTDELDPLEFTGSVNQWLATRDHMPVSSAAQIRAASLPADVPRIDGSDDRVEWLTISERCVAKDGSGVMYSLDYHRGDVFSFHVLRRFAG